MVPTQELGMGPKTSCVVYVDGHAVVGLPNAKNYNL